MYVRPFLFLLRLLKTRTVRSDLPGCRAQLVCCHGRAGGFLLGSWCWLCNDGIPPTAGAPALSVNNLTALHYFTLMHLFVKILLCARSESLGSRCEMDQCRRTATGAGAGRDSGAPGAQGVRDPHQHECSSALQKRTVIVTGATLKGVSVTFSRLDYSA